MDGLSRATTESRVSGQRKVRAATAGAGVAALAVAGLLTVGLGGGSSTAAAATTATTDSSSSDTTGSSSVSGGTGAAVASSGGS